MPITAKVIDRRRGMMDESAQLSRCASRQAVSYSPFQNAEPGRL